MYDNTFYKIKEMEVHPILKIDFGNYNLNESIGKKSINNQMLHIQKTKNIAYFPVLNANNENIRIISYYFNSGNNTFVHEYIELKKIKKIFHTKLILNDITFFPKFISFRNNSSNINHEVTYKNYLVYIALPYVELSLINKNSLYIDKIGQVNELDNPVIVLMKLK